MLHFRVIYGRNCTIIMEMSFFAWNMEMSFFVVCPYIFLIFAQKIGMNRTGIVLSALVAIHPDFRGLALAVT